MSDEKPGRLTRPKQPMPDYIREMLQEEGLVEAYKKRPPYQRNDYLAWIRRAQEADGRARRLGQMLEELRDGDRYMKMAWAPRK